MILYRLVMLLALPVLAVVAWRRGGLAERLALRPLPRDAVWVHGASNGELTSARAVITALAGHGPVLVTCNNPTARVMVEGWGLPAVTARMAPLDAWPVVRGFLRCRPHALLIVENELWPERIVQAPCPVLVIGARMSDRSARRWAKVPLLRGILARLSWVSPQDPETETRLRRLGLPDDRIGLCLTLKTAVVRDTRPLPPLPHGREDTLLAASTHEGEDGIILDAFRVQRRFVWLILAPRHPTRGDAIAALAQARGLTVTQRSRGDMPGGDVYIADTLGEMDLWYRAATATIVGGSFVPKGGHTPYEPAAYESAILHGPDVSNFTEVYASLDANGGALKIDGDLATILDGLTPERRQALTRAARFADGDAPAVVVEQLQRLDVL